MGVPSLMNNTAQTSADEDLVTAEQSCQKNAECIVKHKTLPSLSSKTAPSHKQWQLTLKYNSTKS